MSVIRLDITGLRNLKPVTLSLSPHVNIFYGNNGSGKTSVLEAVYLLSLARSFRSHKINTVINYDVSDCTIFAKVQQTEHVTHQLGINRNKQGDLQIRLDGQTVRTAIQLADILPLQIINPDSFRLLEGSPKLRRQFIDWGVFHSEKRFLAAWQRVQKSLKQRNSWLRQNKKDFNELVVWNNEFCNASEEVDLYRKQYIEQLLPIFEKVLAELLDIKDFTLSYYRGWDKETKLETILNNTLERDLQMGHTQAGSQRADLRLKLGGFNAADVLSRGQQKLVVCALKIAQGYIIDNYKKGQVIYLIDDLASELDEKHRTSLCRLLDDLKCQIFITGVEKEPIYSLWQSQTKISMFHVEHGHIAAVNEH